MANRIQIGIDIGGTKMLAIAIGADLDARWQIPTGKDFAAIDAQQAIEQFINSLSTRPDSIGIAVPGLVDRRQGIVIACDVLPRLVGWQPAITLSSICPVNVLNDAEAALVKVASDLNPIAVAAVVMVGTGIGAAIWANGTVLRGAKGWAGELGSIPIDGNTLDAQASGAAILQGLAIDADRLSTLVAANDSTACQAIDRAGSALGMGLATMINMLNPEAIVLAGGTFRWKGYLEAALKSAEEYSLPDLWLACQVQLSPHEEDLVALGAAKSTDC